MTWIQYPCTFTYLQKIFNKTHQLILSVVTAHNFVLSSIIKKLPYMDDLSQKKVVTFSPLQKLFNRTHQLIPGMGTAIQQWLICKEHLCYLRAKLYYIKANFETNTLAYSVDWCDHQERVNNFMNTECQTETLIPIKS